MYGNCHAPKVFIAAPCPLSSIFITTKSSTPNIPSDLSVRQERAYAVAICMLTGNTAHAGCLSQHTLWLLKQATCHYSLTGHLMADIMLNYFP